MCAALCGGRAENSGNADKSARPGELPAKELVIGTEPPGGNNAAADDAAVGILGRLANNDEGGILPRPASQKKKRKRGVGDGEQTMQASGRY